MNKQEDQKPENQEHEELTEVVDQEEGQKEAQDQKVVEELNAKIQDLNDKLLRQMAESENVRARSMKSVEEARDYANFGFAKDLVSVMDNFIMALDHVPEGLSDDMKNMVEGIRMTKRELESAFKKHGLEMVYPQPGDKFDYNLHHAISQTETAEQGPGTIVSVMQMGYRVKDRLIRPAAVVVAK